MIRTYLRSLGLLGLLATAGVAAAQGGTGTTYDPFCWPPPNSDGTQPPGFSDGYISYFLPQDPSQNTLFGVRLGVTGTDTYYKSCIPPNGFTFNMPGRIGFTVGSVGSIQSDFDDNLALNFGMPTMTGGSIGYAMVVEGTGDGSTKKTLFGGSALDTAYIGASDRYCTASGTAGSFRVRLQVDLIGDASRLNWQLTNTTTAAVNGGLWFGQWVDLDALSEETGGGPLSVRHAANFVFAPGFKPFRTGTSFAAAKAGTVLPNTVKPANAMPDWVGFGYTQAQAYGLRIYNTANTIGGANNDQTPVDELKVGHATFSGGDDGLLGNGLSNSADMPDELFEDALFADYTNPDSQFSDSAYLQKWYPQPVGVGGTRTINAYYGSTWSNSNYGRPYTTVIDAPNIVSTSPDDPTVLTPNPFTFRVYIDNTRGYSAVDLEVPLENVRVEVDLPPGMTDATDSTSTTMVKYISRINARTMGYVDFSVKTANTVFGALPYTVKITTPTTANVVMTGTINVASTPQLKLAQDANLVTAPWTFDNSSWEAILGEHVDQDFQAFTWDPLLGEYVIQTGPQRGQGTWIIQNQARNSFQLGGNPKEPADLTTGAPLVQLHSGWNLVGNPYNYAFPLGQIVGVSSAAPSQSYTFRQLVNQGVISGGLAYWDQNDPTPEYKYIQADNDMMVPNTGYWIFVNTSQDVTLQFPPIFQPFLPDRSASTSWTQSDREWRLQLVARNDKQLDGQNYVGLAKSTADATNLRIYKPPVAPVDGAVGLSIDQTINGKATKLAQALSDSASNMKWNVEVYSKTAGNVTLTWPNLTTVPKNMQFRLVDNTTGATRDLRKTSGYTFTAQDRTTRVFTIQAVPGTAQRAMIASLTAVRSSRSPNSPLTISYSLAGDATTTVRILLGGREIYVPVQGRSDKAGSNTAVWNLRDAANRAVAPGTYTVELTAEDQDGNRVRKLYPVNITR